MNAALAFFERKWACFFFKTFTFIKNSPALNFNGAMNIMLHITNFGQIGLRNGYKNFIQHVVKFRQTIF